MPIRTPFQGDFLVRVVPRAEKPWAVLCSPFGRLEHAQENVQTPEAFGLAAGTLLEAEVVTADGDIKLANACALAICGAGGPPAYPGVPGHEPDVEKARRDAATVPAAMSELRKLVPRAASYVWETDYFEPNWQDSFWGDNYARLRAIKEKYDPDGLFFLHHGEGSEDWSADGFTRVEAR
jgi:hypothetical protein